MRIYDYFETCNNYRNNENQEMKTTLQCAHCGKTFENQRLLNNHYNELGVDYIESKGFFDKEEK